MKIKVTFKKIVCWFSWITGGIGHALFLLNAYWLITGYYAPPPGSRCATPGAWAFMSMCFFSGIFYVIAMIGMVFILIKWREERDSKLQMTYFTTLLFPLVLMIIPFFFMFFS